MSTLWYSKSEFGSHWLPPVQIEPAGDLIELSDSNAPTAVSYRDDLYIFYLAETTVYYVLLDRSDVVGKPVPLFHGAQHGVAAGVYRDTLYVCGASGIPGTSGWQLLFMYRDVERGLWFPTEPVILEGIDNDPFQPQIVYYNDLLWVFFRTPSTQVPGDNEITCCTIEFAALNKPIIKRMRTISLNWSFSTNQPVGLSVYANRLYLAASSSSDATLHLSYTATSTTADWAKPTPIRSRPYNDTIADPTALYGFGPSLQAYNSLLNLSFYDSSANIGNLTYDRNQFGILQLIEPDQTQHPLRTAVNGDSLYEIHVGIPR
ncbi:Uncharacterised protein [Mycobacteroides abscessus subsp. bolletii]|uniref:hypothetical protein n=1 Tax=Mycobacteroides abscessus TaxID=36809 RepID=UPI00092ACA6F|nr:hypothetical protein [Mycobacteroides abscessus]SIJ06625.1 Uncharacterised protein [Mycobacteroides abscessus subsp. bolletii]SLD79049.1 Uncharacterised protein [Mycobacteroides abscessus subsp. bolletii]SLD86269.1 Uncharacterised protein [Mycobacteroides abscessus subsp. bolletii]